MRGRGNINIDTERIEETRNREPESVETLGGIPKDSITYGNQKTKYLRLTKDLFYISFRMQKRVLAAIALFFAITLCIIYNKIMFKTIETGSEIIYELSQGSEKALYKVLITFAYTTLSSIIREMYVLLFCVYTNMVVLYLSKSLFSNTLYSSASVPSARISRIVDRGNKSVSIFLTKLLVVVLSRFIGTFIILIGIYRIGVIYFSLIISFNILYVIVTYYIIKKRIEYKIELNKHDDLYCNKIMECVRNITVIRSSNTEEHEIKTFRSHLKKLLNTKLRDGVAVMVLHVIQKFIYSTLFLSLMFYAFCNKNNADIVKTAALLIGSVKMLDKNIMDISLAFKEIFVCCVDCEEYVALIKALKERIPAGVLFPVEKQNPLTSPEIVSNQNIDVNQTTSMVTSPFLTHIENTNVKQEPVLIFKNIRFCFPGEERSLICGVSFEVQRGEKICILGRSGCGKSSLLSLLLKKYPYEGEIWINGENIEYLTKKCIAQRVCIVPQDSGMFNNTIEYNLLYGAPSYSKALFDQLVKQLHIERIVQSKKEGYMHIVREEGANLSGGEKQRIALFRALLRMPSILILDESTSKIDSETEKAIMQYLINMPVTLLVITHSVPVSKMLARKILIGPAITD